MLVAFLERSHDRRSALPEPRSGHETEDDPEQCVANEWRKV
jgi:hypothetical protein